MRVTVTGADGFVGRHLVRILGESGHAVTAAVRPGVLGRVRWETPAGGREGSGMRVAEVPLELAAVASVAAAATVAAEAVVHLAGLSSGREALDDPGVAWDVNAAGTARLCQALGRRVQAGEADPLVLVASTAEVYGPLGGGVPARPRVETDPVMPVSPYAASKAGAELAARETRARTGLRVAIVRPFPHTGPGQDARFVAPALARRLRHARRTGTRVVPVGNLEPVRDVLDVRDVCAAYVALLTGAVPGETYNIAGGTGLSVRELFQRLAAIVGVDPIADVDETLVRAVDLPHLVGDARKLRERTGWAPAIPLDRTLQDLVDAQTD